MFAARLKPWPFKAKAQCKRVRARSGSNRSETQLVVGYTYDFAGSGGDGGRGSVGPAAVHVYAGGQPAIVAGQSGRAEEHWNRSAARSAVAAGVAVQGRSGQDGEARRLFQGGPSGCPEPGVLHLPHAVRGGVGGTVERAGRVEIHAGQRIRSGDGQL